MIQLVLLFGKLICSDAQVVIKVVACRLKLVLGLQEVAAAVPALLAIYG